MTEDENREIEPSRGLITLHDERVDNLISNIVKANASGIAACLAAGFQDIPVAFPLGCFLLGALGYGLYQLGEVFSYHEVIIHYLRQGKIGLQELGLKWIKLDDVDIEQQRKLEVWSAYLMPLGFISCIIFFLVGVISGFFIVAF